MSPLHPTIPECPGKKAGVEKNKAGHNRKYSVCVRRNDWEMNNLWDESEFT
jgi:hypothetical protein